MKIFRTLEEIADVERTCVALGNFDGVHKGHQELIRRTVNTAKDDGLKSAVFTFSNHPKSLTSKGVKNIITNDEKAEIIESLGIDYLFDVPFEERIMTMSPDDFIDKLLIEKMNMKEAYCGFNYRFGFKASGTPETMMKHSLEKDFGFHMMEPYKIDGNVVSSTLIRGLIEEGRVDEVEKYMGRMYSVKGTVVVGNKLGRTIGFPTVNLPVDAGMVTPPCGVFTTFCTYNGVRYPAITNVGHKPTVGEFEKNIETNIFNFDEDIYGKDILVEFVKMTRPERKFESFDALAAQISQDCIDAKKYHGIL